MRHSVLPSVRESGLAVHAVDALRNEQEIALVSQPVQVAGTPEPCRRSRSVLRLLQQLRFFQERKVQRLAALRVVRPPRDLDQAAAFEIGAVTGLDIPEVR